MVYNEKMDRKLYQFISNWENISKKKMFGGTAYLINGKMVANEPNVVPVRVQDRFRVGENDGIDGGVKNIRFFTHTLSPNAIWKLSFE